MKRTAKAPKFQVVSTNFQHHAPIEAESFDAAATVAKDRGFEDVEQFGVWLEGADDLELVGTGDTETDALEDAICTTRVWKQNEGRPAGRSYE